MTPKERASHIFSFYDSGIYTKEYVLEQCYFVIDQVLDCDIMRNGTQDAANEAAYWQQVKKELEKI